MREPPRYYTQADPIFDSNTEKFEGEDTKNQRRSFDTVCLVPQMVHLRATVAIIQNRPDNGPLRLRLPLRLCA